jgi:hypothetical protein
MWGEGPMLPHASLPLLVTSAARSTPRTASAGPSSTSRLVHPDSERREAYRLELSPGRARIELADAREMGLRDLSATGSSLILGSSDLGGRSLLAAIFHLPDEPAFRADLRIIRRIRDSRGEHTLGTQFSSLDHTALRSLSRFMVREHLQRVTDIARLVESRKALRTQDPSYIARLLHASAVHDNRPLQVFSPAGPLPVRVQIARLALDGRKDALSGIASGHCPELHRGAELMFLLPGRSSVALFHSVVLDQQDQRILLRMPTEIFQTGFRDSHRTPLAAAAMVSVSFRHPHQPERRIQRAALDVAARGLAFPVDTEHDLLFPGDRLPDLQITLPDGDVLCTTGTIRGMRSDGAGAQGVNCGVELHSFASDRDQRRWHQFVFQTAHPRLQRASARDLDTVWQVFESSQYVDKWIGEGAVSQVQREFRDSWQGAVSRSGEILLLNERERSLGTISANRIYPRTWLMHSLAVDRQARGPGQRSEFLGLARELYSGIMYTLQHEAGTRYFLAYFEETKSWNQRLYRDFARDYVDACDQRYDQVVVYKSSPGGGTGTANAESPPGGSNVQVLRASAEHRKLLAEQARVRLAPILVDALALDEPSIDLQNFSAVCAASGIQRSREILVVTDDGIPALAAICEGGSEGINVFGLMNLCWTIPLGKDPPSEAAVAALMTAVNGHYQARATAEFVLVEASESNRPTLERLGYRFVSPAIRWLARVEVLPAWLSYVENELVADRPATATAA